MRRSQARFSQKQPKHSSDPSTLKLTDDLKLFETQLYNDGVRLVAGVDEAGRGCLAGPVVAGAVVLPHDCNIEGLTDSKLLTPKQRDRFFDIISERAISRAVAVIDSREIDATDILTASLNAMLIAVNGLHPKPDYLLIDGTFGIDCDIPQRAIIKGDRRSLSIAAASVMAKVTRDRLMCEMECKYPAYKFSVHKGYGTLSHRNEIVSHGPTPIHRMTFRGVKK